VKKFGEISKKFHQMRKNEKFLWEILEKGNEKAAKIAAKNMHEIKSLMGLCEV